MWNVDIQYSIVIQTKRSAKPVQENKMGREVKRVSVDFEWPIGKIWKGYLDDVKYNEETDEYEGYYDPPKGEGYQIWETTSEGSPLTPVFENPKYLARYCEIHKVSWLGSYTSTYDKWLAFITGKGWRPTIEFQNGKILDFMEE